jgi:hypothetical protein
MSKQQNILYIMYVGINILMDMNEKKLDRKDVAP